MKRRPQTFTPALPIADLEKAVLSIQSQFRVADESISTTANLLALMHAVPVGGKQVHDANVVATMQTYGIKELLTHNVADFQRYAAYVQVLGI